MEMAYQKIESTFLPGYCPFCLWDVHLPAAKRLHQFCTKKDWETEVKRRSLEWKGERCPDKRCQEKFEDKASFIYHMHDLHHIPKEVLVAIVPKRKAEAIHAISDRKAANTGYK
jgi:hypothetical protein